MYPVTNSPTVSGRASKVELHKQNGKSREPQITMFLFYYIKLGKAKTFLPYINRSRTNHLVHTIQKTLFHAPQHNIRSWPHPLLHSSLTYLYLLLIKNFGGSPH